MIIYSYYSIKRFFCLYMIIYDYFMVIDDYW